MNMSRVGFALALAAFGMTAAGTALAAADGLLGATSTGSLNIDLSINNLVQISELDDINLGTFAVGSDLTGSDDVCVYSNTGGYNITATGSGGGSAFELAGGTDTLPYAVEWDDAPGQTSGTGLTSGTVLNGQASSATAPDCGGGASASVIVTVSQTDLAAAPADTYSGVLTLLVAPE